MTVPTRDVIYFEPANDLPSKNDILDSDGTKDNFEILFMGNIM